jgi:hypothetical protein
VGKGYFNLILMEKQVRGRGGELALEMKKTSFLIHSNTLKIQA